MTTPAHAISSLIRAAVFVRDLDRSSAFYRALGFDAVYFEGELDQASTAAALHTPSTTTARCRILKNAGAPNFGMVGLFELQGPAPEPLPFASGPPRLGETALVFYAKPIEAAIAAARAAGASWSPEASLFVMPHRQQKEVCLRDPDGALINLIERDPAEQNSAQPVAA